MFLVQNIFNLTHDFSLQLRLISVIVFVDREPSGKMGTVVGWGRVSEGGNLADIVQEVQVPILSLSQCRATKYRPQRITGNMICAGRGVEDSCQVCKLELILKYLFFVQALESYLII